MGMIMTGARFLSKDDAQLYVWSLYFMPKHFILRYPTYPISPDQPEPPIYTKTACLLLHSCINYISSS